MWFCLQHHFDLANGVGEGLNNLLMCCGHHTLPVDLDDPVTHADASSLSDASSHQAAYLPGETHATECLHVHKYFVLKSKAVPPMGKIAEMQRYGDTI